MHLEKSKGAALQNCVFCFGEDAPDLPIATSISWVEGRKERLAVASEKVPVEIGQQTAKARSHEHGYTRC